MSFIRYPSLSKLGNKEVESIEFGTTHVFPKLDGTNASMWLDLDTFGYGSRNRQLSHDDDNAGFMNELEFSEKGYPYKHFLRNNPDLILYGEWLVPHTLKEYRDDAWKRFYVFDVYDRVKEQFLHYDVYKPLMDKYGLDYIPCIKIIKNGTGEMFAHELDNARFMLKDTAKAGEGIVIKNYAWESRFGRQTWAKMIGGEFKDDFHKQWEPAEKASNTNEETIVAKAVTPQLVEKEYAKIVTAENGWSSKYIPRLLETVFHCVVTEELYSCWKLVKHGTINGQALRAFTIQRVKELKPELF